MALEHALLETVRHQHVRHATVEREHAPVAAEPVAALHVLGGARVQQLTEAEYGDEHPGAMDLAGLEVEPLDRITGVIDFDALASGEPPGR